MKYVVTVKTGDKSGAGTDSNVYLSVLGDKSKFESVQLDDKVTKSKQNLFERKSTDEFELDQVDVGKIQSIKIGHDGKKLGSSWFLESIRIDFPIGSYYWKVDKWLDKDEGTAYVELKSTQAVFEAAVVKQELAKKVENTKQPQLKYNITVKTGDKMGAGTDSNVYLTLIGDKSKTEPILLDSKVTKGKKNLYEKNSTDEFEVSAVDVGKIQSIKIGHDGAKMGSSWYLEFIKIVSPSQTFLWKVDKWLDKDEGTAYIELKSTQAVADAKPEPVKDTKKPENQVKYQVTVKTGDKMSAGTDSNVYLSIFGDKSKAESILLDSKVSKSKKNLYEKNSTDEFEVSAVDVGKIQSIKIGHDGAKMGSSWYLEFIKIVSPAQTFLWKVDKWLDKDEGTAYIELKSTQAVADAKPEPVKDTKKPANQVKYQVTVKTGDKLGAGTDSNVYLTLIGDKSRTEPILLDSKVAKGKKNLFEKSNSDEFELNDVDVGKIQSIKIGHDGKKVASSWYLDSVKIVSPSDTLIWKVDKWLDPDEGTGYVELTAAQAGKQEQPANKQAKKPSESQVKYQVTIKTGDKTGAGTDSAVRLSIYGDKSQIESVQLDQNVAVNAKKKNLFEKNSLDEFQLNGDNIGTIDRIKIGHDGSKLAAAWYLESITVKTPNETKTWTVNRWLDKDDGTAYVELHSKEKPEKKEPKQNVLVQGSQKDDDKPKDVDEEKEENLVGKIENLGEITNSDELKVDEKLNTVDDRSVVENTSENKPLIDEKPAELNESKHEEEEVVISSNDAEATLNDESTKVEPDLTPHEPENVQNNDQPLEQEQPIPSQPTSETVINETIKTLSEMNRKQYEPKVSNKSREESIKIEFRRLKTSLDKEVQKLKFPQRKEHQPYVFNDLNPYYDVNHLEHLINSRDQLHPVGYYNRFTALSIVEPWVAYRMDHTYAPMSSRSVSLNRTNRSQVAAKNLTDRPNENEITGSTLAPNFPKLVIKKPKNLNGPFFFDDVVNIRKELKKNMTSTTRFEEDRNRTINDYYRMNLDQTAENDNMRKAYNAYLQNTPGSKKALLELLNQHHEQEKNKTNDDDDEEEKIKKVDDKKEQPASSSPTNDNNNKVEVKVNQS